MNITEIQIKYRLIIHDLKIKGNINRILFFFQLLFLVAYYTFPGIKSLDIWGTWIANVAIIIAPIILTINSITFVNSHKVRSVKQNFKNDFFQCVKQEIPEFVSYIPAQKIHPRIFYSSSLFRRRYDDYIGDDWISGHYKGIPIELCELHVFKLFKVTFNGIFVRCKFSKIFERTVVHFSNRLALTGVCSPVITEQIIKFCEKNNATVHLSYIQNNIFIAFNLKGSFFENKNRKTIDKLDKDFFMLQEIAEIMRTIISEQNCNIPEFSAASGQRDEQNVF
jgi:hypothetical protein